MNSLKGFLVKIKHKIEYFYFKNRFEWFSFDDSLHHTHNHPYFYHPYNATWIAERKVEIPIFKEFIAEYRPSDILEVGNVLSHYFPISHTVVDKYEKAQGVINEDVVTFSPPRKYKCIISISTLEHVGIDEEEKDPEKVLKAIANLLSLLEEGGTLFFSCPQGHNSSLDNFIRSEGKYVEILVHSKGILYKPAKIVNFVKMKKGGLKYEI